MKRLKVLQRVTCIVCALLMVFSLIPVKPVKAATPINIAYAAGEDATINGGPVLNVSAYAGKSTPITSVRPVRASCNLIGWTKTKNSGHIDYYPGMYATFSKNTTLWPVWNANIALAAGDGKYPSGVPVINISVTLDTPTQIPSTVPSRSGYTFEGWTTTKGSGTVVYKPNTTVTFTKPVTLWPVWKSVSNNATTTSAKPTIGTTSIIAAGGGETRKIPVNPQGKTWNVSNNSAPTWITAKKENNMLVLTMKENTSTVKRSGTVAITVGDKSKGQVVTILSITISQAPKYTASVDKKSIAVPVNGSTTSVAVIVTGGEWTATVNKSWITLSKSGNALKITAAKNTSKDPRTATITIKCGNASCSISVSQTSYFKRFFADHSEFVETDNINKAPRNSAVERDKTITIAEKMDSFLRRSPKYNPGFTDEAYIVNIWERTVPFQAASLSPVLFALPLATQFLRHYLFENGDKVEFNANDTMMNSDGPGPEKFSTTTTSLMRMMEGYLTEPNQTIAFTDKDSANRPLSFSGDTRDEYFALKECSLGLAASCTFDGEKYHMFLNYFIQDYYDFYYRDGDDNSQAGFSFKLFGIDLFSIDEFAFLEAFEMVHPFEVCGVMKTEITWYKGQEAKLVGQSTSAFGPNCKNALIYYLNNGS